MEEKNLNDLGHWVCEFDVPEDTYGFLYRITNIESGKMYIGKKQMSAKRKLKPLKGKKNKRIKIVETDWKTYTGSCAKLNEDIEEIGKDKFKFEIIRLCSSKWELAYYEAEIQFGEQVLLKEEYYNGIVNCRINKMPKKLREPG